MMNMLFVITCRAWKALFQGKVKEEVAKLERRKTGGKEMKKTTQQLILLLKKQVIKGNVF
jgi:hypothetical protein